MSKLTPRQQLFVEEYIECWNATKSAIKAGYSEKSAYSQGYRLLKNAQIKAEISKRQSEILERFQLNKQDILSELQMLKATAISKGQTRVALEIAKEINKILGIYEPDKVDVTSDGGSISINYVVPKD